MTILRTALRLCVSAALKGKPGARPSIAEHRVYDSRVSDFDPENSVGDALPTVILLTDKDEGDALSRSQGGSPFRREVDIVLEIAMIQTTYVDNEFDENGDPVAPYYRVMYPDTDARLEASLDVLETQLVHHLSYNLDDKFAALFRSFARITKMECHRQVMDDASIKIAARILTLTCDVGDDQVQVYTVGSAPTGLDILPEPMRRVAKALDPNSEGGKICAMVATALSPMTAGKLEAMNLIFTQPDGTPNIEAELDLSGET